MSGGKFETLKKYKTVILLGGSTILFVGLVALLSFLFMRGDTTTTSKTDFSRVCSDMVLKRASASIESNNLVDLKSVQDDIINLAEYKKDQNCMFVLLRYSTLRNDSIVGFQQLDLLKKVYLGTYSAAITTPTMTPDEFETILKFIESRNQQIQLQSEETAKNMTILDQNADALVEGQ